VADTGPGNRPPRATVSLEMPRRLRPSIAVRAVAAAAAIGFALASCSALGPGVSPTGGPGSSPGSSPGPTILPSPTFGPDQIEHATGATDLVLRWDEEGGFVGPGALVTHGPGFSLYGDGTTIFRDPAAIPPEPVGGLAAGGPYQIVRLNEEQIQSLLQFAIGPGGLGVARATYQLPVADAPTAVFTLVAAGTTKTVSVNGLGLGAQAGPDSIVLGQLEALRTRLAAFGNDVAGEGPWSPDRYRCLLIDESFNPPMPWPWPDIKPSDFVVHNGANDPRFPIRTMSPAEVSALGVGDVKGGEQGLSLKAPDGKTYGFSLRPLLPDEQY
jgi:hypothetical protein